MKIHNSIEDFTGTNNTVVTTGTFDGLHPGHLKIIDSLKQNALDLNLESVVLTFHPHPRIALFPDDNNIKLLMTIDEKVEHFRKLGIDHLIIHPFTKEFSRTSFVHYIRDLLVSKMNMSHLIVGHDHQFGKNREGTIQNIKELEELYGFKTSVVSALQVQEINVSSTKIRNALFEGEVYRAAKLLGYKYSLRGKVVHGDKKGRELGYPTANIIVEDSFKLIPHEGVYVVKIKIANVWFGGMMNVGGKPTFNKRGTGLEVHIFSFAGDIYNQVIDVKFIKRIRSIRKFESLQDLKRQLEQDKILSLNIL